VIAETLAREAMVAEQARRVAWRGSRQARRSRQVFAEIETRPSSMYMSRGSLTIVHQD
jgi:hypothetical protein